MYAHIHFFYLLLHFIVIIIININYINSIKSFNYLNENTIIA